MIWFTLALFVASFLLTILLAPRPEIENARPGSLSNLKFPQSSAGSPIPVIFGRVRQRAPNTLWYGAFASVATTTKIKTSIFSSKDQITGYKYYVSMDLGICLGPDVTLYNIWVEKGLLAKPSPPANGDGVLMTTNQPNLFGGDQKGGGMAGIIKWYSGGFSQSRNTYLASKATNGADYPAYVGVAHAVFETYTFTVQFFDYTVTIVNPYYIGNSASLRALSFEVSRYPDNLGLGANRLIGDDLNPAEIIYSLMIEEWGGLGVDPGLIDASSFVSVGNTLFTEGNGASITIDTPNRVSSVIEEMLRQVDGIMYQDPITGKIVMKLIRDDYSIPSLPVYDETNVASVQLFTRSAWSETINQVRVIYNDRSRLYNEATGFIQDLANILTQGRIHSTDISFPGVNTAALANTLAARELSQLGVPLFRVTLRVNRNASLMKVGDVFKLTWSKYGINQVIMRVTRFDFGELINGNIVMEAIQDQFAIADTIFNEGAGSLDDPGDLTAVDITDYNVFASPYIFINRLNPPFSLTPDSSYIWALARTPNSRQDGYSLFTSTDDFVSSITTELNRIGFPFTCKLQTDVWKNQAQDDGILSKIVVELPEPPGIPFATSTVSQIRTDGKGLIKIGNEWMAYEGYTDNLDGTYDLNTVHRALLDSTFEDHLVGDTIYLILGIEWLSETANPDIGVLYYQLPSFTYEDAQDLNDFPTQAFTRDQRYDRPLPPDLMEIEGFRGPIEIIGVTDVDITDFIERDRTDPDEFVLVGDGADTPEAGTSYTLTLSLDGTLVIGSSGNTYASLPINLSGLSGSGIGEVRIWSFVGLLTSFTYDWWEFFYAYYQNLSSERLTNGGFESAIGTGWTVVSGTWSNPTTVFPLDPVKVVGASSDDQHLQSTGTSNELRQDYTIPGPDAGKSAIVRARKGGLGSATGQLIIELRDGGGALDTITTPLVAADTTGKWELLEIPISLRSDATTVRVRISAPSAGSVWDNISLKDHTISPVSNFDYDSITGVTINGAWGLRKMVSAYSGPLVRIRDTYDDSEQDVGIDPDNNLEPFFVMEEARVVTLYDQSGNGVDLTAASAAQQPRLFWNLTETGRSYIDFTGSCHLRDATTGTSRPYMTTRPTLCAAFGPKRDTAAAYIVTIPHDTTHTSPFYRWGVRSSGTQWEWSIDGTENSDAGNGNSNSGKNVLWIDYQNGDFYHNNDATAAAVFTPANITYPNSTRLLIGEDADGNNNWTGLLCELAIFDDGGISAVDRQTVMEDLGLYWFNLAI